jgi:hypothetical protein
MPRLPSPPAPHPIQAPAARYAKCGRNVGPPIRDDQGGRVLRWNDREAGRKTPPGPAPIRSEAMSAPSKKTIRQLKRKFEEYQRRCRPGEKKIPAAADQPRQKPKLVSQPRESPK